MVDQTPGEEFAARNVVVHAQPPFERNDCEDAASGNVGASSWLASQPFPWFSLQPGLQPLVGSAGALGGFGESESLSVRQRLLQQVVLLMWCLNAELRSADREAAVLTPPAQELALKLGFHKPSVQRLLQQMAQEQFKLHRADWVDTIESREFGRVQQEITNALGGLERIRHQPLPASSTFFIRALTWVYGYLVFLKLDAIGPSTAALVGWLVFLIFLMAERIGTYLEHPFVDARFALPMDRFCTLISFDLLGASDPLAQPSPTKGPWMR